MDSQRLIINNYDLSTTSLTTTTTQTGFTVVKAPKGPITPVLISANSAQGATKQMKEIFGDWSKDYPDLYELAQFISGGYDCYVSAPYVQGEGTTVPVAYVTAEGVLPRATNIQFNKSVEEKILGISAEEIEGIDVFSGTDVNVLYNMNYMKTYRNVGTDMEGSYPQDGGSAGLSFDTGVTTVEAFEQMIGGLPGCFYIHNLGFDDMPLRINGNKVYEGAESETVEVGSYSLENGKVKIFIKGNSSAQKVKDTLISASKSEDKRKKVVAYYRISIQTSKIRATVLPKYPSARITELSFRDFSSLAGRSSTDVAVRNEFVVTAYDTGTGAYGNTGTPATSTVHLNTGASSEEYKTQNIIAVIPVGDGFTDADKTEFRDISGYPAVQLLGGTRDLTPSLGGSLYNLGWQEAEDDTYSDVDIFFESCPAHESAPDSTGAFYSLASIHTLSGFVYNYTIAPTAISTASPNTFGSAYWNICNIAKVVDSSKGSIWSPMTGSYAKMLCNIIKNRWGGVAPMYLNSAGMGGQLQGMENVKVLKYNYKKDAQMKLDAKNFNPVIKDSTYGVMVVGQKTSKSGAVTDWSYIGHVSAFLNFEKEIKNNVMIPQLGKANNDYYRALRAQQVEAYLAKRLQGSTRIWAAASVDTSTADGCNDAAARKARKFVINVKVKVDIFSEYVELNFVNVDQDMTV